MTVTSAIAAYGTQLQMDDGALNYTSIAELRDVSGPQIKANFADVTNHSSTGSYMERIPTTLDMGQISFKINFVPTAATHNATAGLTYVLTQKAKRSFKLIFPDSTNWVCKGFVASVTPSEPVAGELNSAIVIQLTGSPTFSA